ncbi:MauE/DoxX family redox-associated membrane protein [Mucilaginibacter galii]|uniref:Membrane protein n=1 Tax=Mucilaginibacter galii TaxID=2005073 RepID=A0A917J534_9SPHI|nr:MauE/DoxX family redox-associated membrane protein [Mucilaginibacter galii]GGI49345.1 membrane protein [Mucilaginibacter galii]
MSNLKKISLVILIIAYIAAGINHFIHPDGYIKIIPDYLPYHHALNYIAGACEIIFGVMLIFPASRNAGIVLLILMLAAFLPVHITMLQQAPLQLGNLYVTPLIAWIRLVFQPVLMLWLAWHWQTKRVSHA